MRVFDQQLLRLKQALALTEDQAVAAALGMTKAAFADRKRRDAFPVDKLKALAVDQPGRIDVKYVLTGTSDELERRMAAIGTATRISQAVSGRAEKRAVQQAVFHALSESLSAEEQQLVHYFRGASDDGKSVLLRIAAELPNTNAAAGAKSRSEKPSRRKRET